MIPAAIRKLHLAKINNEVAQIWGDGTAEESLCMQKIWQILFTIV